MALIRFVLLFAAGLVTGAAVCIWLLEHALAGSPAFYTEFKQLEIRAFTVPLTALGAIVVITALACAAYQRQNRRSMAFTLAALLCFGIGAVVTARGHFPMNDSVRTWSVNAPPADWAEVRDRWRRLHDLRTALLTLGFAFIIAGTTPPRQVAT